MAKCKKCGSKNVNVNLDQIYTSDPPMYSYRCNDCGEFGYIYCNEAYIGNDDNNLDNDSLDNEKINTPKDEIKGGLLGWICPKCGRCYSPYTTMCTFCNNDMTWKITC